jgi:hypothetical protein
VHFVLNGSADVCIRSVLLPALQNVLQPIMAAEKSKKSLARPGYVDPCAPPLPPPKPEPEEAANALLAKAVKQTALLSEVIPELREMRVCSATAYEPSSFCCFQR